MRLTDVVLGRGSTGPTVADEADRVGLAIDQALRSDVTEFLDGQRRRLTMGAAVSGLLVLIGLLLLVVGGSVGVYPLVLGIAVGAGMVGYVRYDSPDVTVTRVNKGYWTGYRIPAEDGTYVYDATGYLPATEFELELIQDPDSIEQIADELSSPPEYPAVMEPDGGVETSLLETMEEARAELEAADRHAVELPIVGAEDDAAAALSRVAREAGASAVDTPRTVSPSAAVENVEDLTELEEMAGDAENADLPRIGDAGDTIGADLTDMQEDAVAMLNRHVDAAADAFGTISYHFYCPDCLQDDIECRLTPQDVTERTLYCRTCRTEHLVAEAVPRHRIKDDLVNPIWDQLWIEKDDERRRIYENIEDQKSELEEREFEQRREEIRSATDRIRDLRSRIRDLKTDAKAAEGKVDEIGELMVKYDRINEERKETFRGEVEESLAEIDRETDRILEETRNQEQERIDAAQKAAKEKAKTIRAEKRRREAEMFMARQEREDRRKAAEMQQQAALHDEEMDIEKRQHREEWMLETRGRTSFSGHVDNFKLKKDRLLGASVHDPDGGDD